jgi:hypothetical protein
LNDGSTNEKMRHAVPGRFCLELTRWIIGSDVRIATTLQDFESLAVKVAQKKFPKPGMFQCA